MHASFETPSGPVGPGLVSHKRWSFIEVSCQHFVWLQKDSKVYFTKADKVKREDIAKYLGNNIYTDSGYEWNASIDMLLSGLYTTMVVMVNKNGGNLCIGG